MVSNRITEGVGKKIVEALKMQSDIEIQQVVENPAVEENTNLSEEASDIEFVDNNNDENISSNEYHQPQENVFEKPAAEEHLSEHPSFSNFQPYQQAPSFEQPVMPNVMTFNTPPVMEKDNFANELEGFEIPTNVAVLKQLINQLPSGVSKQTGAQIIRQTMEALGISMKGVLQEAQQVQEGLNNSSRDCQATIMEYKRQIGVLEKQAQKFQRQYTALNDIISLFIQTNN